MITIRTKQQCRFVFGIEVVAKIVVQKCQFACLSQNSIPVVRKYLLIFPVQITIQFCVYFNDKLVTINVEVWYRISAHYLCVCKLQLFV